MQVNADLGLRAVVHCDSLPWERFAEGVERKVLERFEVGGRGYGTLLVRLAAGAALPPTAAGCEDLLVLEGGIEDHDFYPAGTYLHSPPASGHRLVSEEGATVVMKTRPTGDHDRYRVVVDISAPSWRPGRRDGVLHMPLRELSCSRVVLLQVLPGARIDDHVHVDGEEFFVLQGGLIDDDGSYPARTWVRQPPGSRHAARAPEGALLWTTAGHLTPSFVASVTG